MHPRPLTVHQLLGVVAQHVGGPARLVGIYPEAWCLAKHIRRNIDGRRLRVGFGKPWPDEDGMLVVLVAEFTWGA